MMEQDMKYVQIFFILGIGAALASIWHYVDHHFRVPPDSFFEGSVSAPGGTKDVSRYVDVYPGFLTGSPVIQRLVLRDARGKKDAELLSGDADANCLGVRWDGPDQVIISVCDALRSKVGERMVGDVRLRIELRKNP
ncbi:MAG: hypothetical protein ACRDBL_08090 [Rhabdaerophilum sp.]